jgi:hypothetical protein
MPSKKKIVFPAPLTLNRKNLLALADEIFSAKGEIRVRPLCKGSLIQAGATCGVKRTHCAVGEMFHTFVSSNPRVLYDLERRNPDATNTAIQRLGKVAQLKDESQRSLFEESLDRLVSSNDNSETDLEELMTYVRRARDVADEMRTNVASFLK